MNIAICRLKQHSHWIFPVRCSSQVHGYDASDSLSIINKLLPDGEQIEMLYLIQGAFSVASYNVASDCTGVFFEDFSQVLFELLAASLHPFAKAYAFDQYRLDSFLNGARYYKRVSATRVPLTEADLRRILLKSRHSFEECFKKLHAAANSISTELFHKSDEQFPFSEEDINGVLHAVYLKEYDSQCNAAARMAVARMSGSGVKRRRSV